MRNASISAIACAMVAVFAASGANANPDYAAATNKPCSYCHVDPRGGGTLTSAGDYYSTYGLLPPPPTVTSITASSGPNTGTVSITNLAGTTFLAGATVKLTKAGSPDVPASSVTVVSPTKITCVFNLTGKKTGLWNVSVANTDGLSGLLPDGFGVNVASSTPLVATGIQRLRDAIVGAASTRWRYRVWGKVQVINSSTFWLDDGSGATIKVFAPGYSGIANGNYAGVTGTVDASTSPTTLVSSSTQIVKFF